MSKTLGALYEQLAHTWQITAPSDLSVLAEGITRIATLELELAEERAEHRRQVDEWTSRCEALERELAEARAEWHPTSLRAAWDSADAGRKAAEAKVAELEEYHIQVADELTAAEAKVVELERELARAEAKLAEVRRENSTMRVRLDALEANQRDDEAKLARVAALVDKLWNEGDEVDALFAWKFRAALAPEDGP
jgi:chromosome segregation ATPase